MILAGIDIGKNKHTFSMVDKETGEILSNPSDFNNNQEGFLLLIKKNEQLDSLTICDVIGSIQRKKPYRITKINRFDLYEQKQLTRHHHNLKEYGIVFMNILITFSSAAEEIRIRHLVRD